MKTTFQRLTKETLERLRPELRKLEQRDPFFFEPRRSDEDDCPLCSLFGLDAANETTLWDTLSSSGITLPTPQELDDVSLGKKLWEVIEAMALAGAYLDHTDHLSDRDLYTWLWSDCLREPTELLPESGFVLISPIGGCSEEDDQIYLRYYADEEVRKLRAREYDEPLPPRENPPFDRDRRLPGWSSRPEGSQH